MVFNKDDIPKGMQVLNFRQASDEELKEDIPILIPNEALQAIQEGDEEPFYKNEVLDWPTKGTGGVYERSFFESYVKVTKNRPIPGSKRGHEFLSRPHTDFYTIGGKVTKNDDGKSGKVFLKIYVPKMGDGSDNAGLIRDMKAGIVNFSLVTYPEYTVKREQQADGTEKDVLHFMSSKGGERNDAVEYGMGAMAQTVNTKQENSVIANKAGYRWSRRMVKENNVEVLKRLNWGDTEWKTVLGPEENDWAEAEKHFLAVDTNASEETRERLLYPVGKNGKVYRSALLALKQKASGEVLEQVNELLTIIDANRKNSNGGQTVDKDELFALLKNMVANNQTNLGEIANAVGLGDLVRNETDKVNAGIVAQLGGRKIEDILAENKAHADSIVEGKVLAIVKNKTIKMGDGTEKENPAFLYAKNSVSGKTGEELDKAVANLTTDEVFKALNKAIADSESSINRVDNKGETAVVESVVLTY